MLDRLSLTRFRREITRVLPAVIAGETRVIIARHGKAVACLVSMRDFDRLWSWEDDDLSGPKDPETGKRPGMQWVRETGWKASWPPLKPRPPEADGEAVAEKRKRWGLW